jgi:hypothetical protein
MSTINDLITQHEEKTTRPQQERPKMEWVEAVTFETENLKAVVSKTTQPFPQYSYRIGGSRGPFIRVKIERGSFNTPSMVVDDSVEFEYLKAQVKDYINSELVKHHEGKVEKSLAWEQKKDSKTGVAAPRVTGKTARDKAKKAHKA